MRRAEKRALRIFGGTEQLEPEPQGAEAARLSMARLLRRSECLLQPVWLHSVEASREREEGEGKKQGDGEEGCEEKRIEGEGTGGRSASAGKH